MPPPIFDQLTVLSDPLRVRLLLLLEREELGVGELARVVQSPQSTVSRQLKALRLAGWLSARAEGTATLLRASEPAPAPSLWDVVSVQAPLGAEDLRRLDSVIAARAIDSRAFFGRVAATWDPLRAELYGTSFIDETLLYLLPASLELADLGCGTGHVVARLAPVVRRVVGVDREQAMLQAARQRTEGLDNVSLRHGELAALPLADDEVDLSLLMLVLHHVEQVPAALAEAQRVSRQGVVICDMVAHQRTDYRHRMGHRHLGFTADDLAACAQRAGLELRRHQILRPDPDARGPGLFVALLG